MPLQIAFAAADYDEVHRQMISAYGINTTAGFAGDMRRALDAITEPGRQEDEVARLLASYGDEPIRGSVIFWLFLEYGRYAEALDLLYRIKTDRNFVTFTNGYWVWHERWADMRRTPEFKRYVTRIGFPDIWKRRGWPDLCHPVGDDDFACG